MHPGSQLGGSGKSLREISSNFFHFSQSNRRRNVPASAMEKLCHKIGPLAQADRLDRGSAQVIPTLADKPGVAENAPSQHDAVNAGFFKHAFGILRSEDVSIADYGDPRLFLNTGDNVPVGFAGKEVAARATVNSKSFDAAVFGNF